MSQQQQAGDAAGGNAASPAAVLAAAEADAVPAVFRGLVSSWPALSRWAGGAGLEHLRAVAGQAPVQAMMSRSCEFFGDIQQLQPVQCSLGELLDLAQQQPGQAQQAQAQQQQAQAQAQAQVQAQQQAQAQQQQQQQPAGGCAQAVQPHLYLAQQPLDEPGLAALLGDVPDPPLLEHKQLASRNLWFSASPSRSSLHHDHHSNLLCVVTGAKAVTLYSPGAAAGLYPQPLGGEAANHSAVHFAAPDLQQHPLYDFVAGQQECRVALQPGDALFIPEGWWHQVDSDGMTLAVNFWWPSDLALLLQRQRHMAHHHLRQLLGAASSEAAAQLLAAVPPWEPQLAAADAAAGAVHAPGEAGQGAAEAGSRPHKRQKPGRADEAAAAAASEESAVQLDMLEQAALGALLAAAEAAAQQHDQQPAAEQLLPLPHRLPPQQAAAGQAAPSQASQPAAVLVDVAWWRRTDAAQQQLLLATAGRPPGGGSSTQQPHAAWLGLAAPVTRVLRALSPRALLRVLWALAGAPGDGDTLAALLSALPPAAAQLLTQGLEAGDVLFADGGGDGGGGGDAAAAGVSFSRAAFYRRLWGDAAARGSGGDGGRGSDRSALLRSLLAAKEQLGAAALELVLAPHVGTAGS